MAEWGFTKLLAPRAFGYRGAKLGIQRLKLASQELQTTAVSHPILAAEGFVDLVKQIGPAFERVDPGADELDRAVTQTLKELIPVFVAAQVDREIRERWIRQLWDLVHDDGIGYLNLIEERWGELCASPELASQWADELIGVVRSLRARGDDFAPSICICLSSLLRAERHTEIWALLDTPLRSGTIANMASRRTRTMGTSTPLWLMQRPLPQTGQTRTHRRRAKSY